MSARGTRVLVVKGRNYREVLGRIKQMFGQDVEILDQRRSHGEIQVRIAVPENQLERGETSGVDVSPGSSQHILKPPSGLIEDDISYRDTLVIKPRTSSPNFSGGQWEMDRGDEGSPGKAYEISEAMKTLLSMKRTLEAMIEHFRSRGLLSIEESPKHLSGAKVVLPSGKLTHSETRLFSGSSEEPSNYLKGKQSSPFSPVEVARELLVKSGVEFEKAERMVSEIEFSSIRDLSSLREVLKNHISKKIRATGGLPLDGKKIYTFVGPTGVGKTTTLVKIAAMARLKKRRRVAFVTLDFYKLGAREQLDAFASILRAPMEFVTSPEQFSERVAYLENAGFDIIFVDTAGRSALNDYSINELSSFLERVPRSENILVLPAGYTYHYMLRTVENFSEAIPISSVILSKVDETPMVGHVLNVMLDYPSLEFSYITTGQSVPDDIEEATPYNLASLIIEGYRGS